MQQEGGVALADLEKYVLRTIRKTPTISLALRAILELWVCSLFELLRAQKWVQIVYKLNVD